MMVGLPPSIQGSSTASSRAAYGGTHGRGGRQPYSAEPWRTRYITGLQVIQQQNGARCGLGGSWGMLRPRVIRSAELRRWPSRARRQSPRAGRLAEFHRNATLLATQPRTEGKENPPPPACVLRRDISTERHPCSLQSAVCSASARVLTRQYVVSGSRPPPRPTCPSASLPRVCMYVCVYVSSSSLWRLRYRPAARGKSILLSRNHDVSVCRGDSLLIAPCAQGYTCSAGTGAPIVAGWCDWPHVGCAVVPSCAQ